MSDTYSINWVKQAHTCAPEARKTVPGTAALEKTCDISQVGKDTSIQKLKENDNLKQVLSRCFLVRREKPAGFVPWGNGWPTLCSRT